MCTNRVPLRGDRGNAWPKTVGGVPRPGRFDAKNFLAGDVATDRLCVPVGAGLSMSLPMPGCA